ncbi:uncharacterized protein LOC144421111 [Styela clava]
MIYSDCPTMCPRTCAAMEGSRFCTRRCLSPGCVCPDDMYLLNMKTPKCVTYKQCVGYCKVRFQEKCYWVSEISVLVTYSEAEVLCKQHNASLANIYNKEQADEMSKKFPNWLVGWIGMSIIGKDSDKPMIANYNGSQASYVSWLNSYPKLGGGKNNIAIKYDKTKKTFSMTNYYPDTKFDGAVCEI